jgi:hypothetical protein
LVLRAKTTDLPSWPAESSWATIATPSSAYRLTAAFTAMPGITALRFGVASIMTESPIAVTPPDGTAAGGRVVGTGALGAAVGLGSAVGAVVEAGRGTGVVEGLVGGAVASERGGNVEAVVDGGGCTFVVDGTDGSDPVVPSERTNEPVLR